MDGGGPREAFGVPASGLDIPIDGDAALGGGVEVSFAVVGDEDDGFPLEGEACAECGGVLLEEGVEVGRGEAGGEEEFSWEEEVDAGFAAGDADAIFEFEEGGDVGGQFGGASIPAKTELAFEVVSIGLFFVGAQAWGIEVDAIDVSEGKVAIGEACRAYNGLCPTQME